MEKLEVSELPMKRKSSSSFTIKFFVAVAFYVALAGGVHYKINEIQPTPYMDEIFHVPQTQKYCQGLYSEWDPKITTLPGTYMVATGVLRTLGRVLPIGDPCSTSNLRAFNLGVSVMNLIMIYHIVGFYSPEISTGKRVLSALNIASFPVLYFFSFLYYTDAVSTAFLLLMHCFYLNGRYGFSALAGGYSVITRQTNIVWVMYHGIISILDILTSRFGDMMFMHPLEYRKYIMGGQQQSKGKKGKRTKAKPRGRKLSKTQPQLPSLGRIWQECGDEFGDRGCAYVLVGIAFLMFIVYNGSIVVGDKKAHQATLNFPQLGYFALVFGAFTAPFVLFRVKDVVGRILQMPCNLTIISLIVGGLIYCNSPVHPYLLADNRHYTFYIWKRFYEHIPCFRFLWIPVYMFSWLSLFSTMGIEKVYLFTYFLCTAVNIVPQLLMEFRYFIPAYLLARMTFRNVSWMELFLEFAISHAVNLATLYLFLYKPFKWPDSDDTQRFMW